MIVSDSSTLILLAKVELLELFIQHAKHPLVISDVVEQECTARQGFDSLLIAKLIKEKKILVMKTKKTLLAQEFSLGQGEASILYLAHAEKANLVLIDDKQGMHACKLLRLSFMSSMNLVVTMYQRKLITQEKALTKIDALARWGRYAPFITADVKRRIRP